MKNTYITAVVCCLLAALSTPAVQAQEAPTFVEAPASAAEKPIIAVPLFVNKSKGQTKRIAPGKYTSKAKYEATVRLDVDANDEKSRYIDKMDVEYADGEWQLPDEATEIATDAATSAIVGTRRFRVLSRSTPALKSVDAEILFQGTGAEAESTQVFSSLKSCNAKYLLLGRLNRFRVDRTEGEAYGVLRRQVVTSVSVDMQLIDVNTMEIIAGDNMMERVVMRIPSGVTTTLSMVWWQMLIVIVGITALILLIVLVNDAERRIPVQYAKRVVGRKVYGGQNTNLPIKVSMTGVMPVIFAQSICSLPATICTFGGWTNSWVYKNLFASSTWIYAIFYFLLIFFFSWFYAAIQYDPVEISNNLKKNGGFIPGFRPGKPTADFIKKVINKIVVFGAVYLGIVALLPIVAGNLVDSIHNLAIGGTSVIIVVSVALETVKALEAQMLMRHYKGFLD